MPIYELAGWIALATLCLGIVMLLWSLVVIRQQARKDRENRELDALLEQLSTAPIAFRLTVNDDGTDTLETFEPGSIEYDRIANRIVNGGDDETR